MICLAGLRDDDLNVLESKDGVKLAERYNGQSNEEIAIRVR